MLRLLLATVLAATAITPALAREDADLNSQLRAMAKWSNEPWHIAAAAAEVPPKQRPPAGTARVDLGSSDSSSPRRRRDRQNVTR